MWNGTVTSRQHVREAAALLRMEGPVERPVLAHTMTVKVENLLVKVYVYESFGEGPPGYLAARVKDVKESLEKELKVNPTGRKFGNYIFGIAFLYGFQENGVQVSGLDLMLFRASPSGSRDLRANLMMDPWSFANERRTETRTEGAMCSAETSVLGRETDARREILPVTDSQGNLISLHPADYFFYYPNQATRG